MIKVASLFSGIGGFEKGIMDALGEENVEVVFSSEIDKYAAKSYEILHKLKPHGDVTKVNEKDVPDHDLLVAGFPCQSFSISGKRGGFSDTRGTLFFEICRIAKEKKPKMMLLENVKGLTNHDKGRTFETIKNSLEDLGYTVHTKILNSKFYGVPQNRERIYLACFLEDKHFSFPNEKKVSNKLKDILEEKVDEKYYLSEERTKTFVPKKTDNDIKTVGKIESMHQRGIVYDTNGISGCLTATDYKDPKIIVEGNIEDSWEMYSRIYSDEGLAPTLMNRSDLVKIVEVGHIENKYDGKDMYRVFDKDGISPTLTRGGSHHRLINDKPFRIRKLTPLECFRLQSFPDEWIHILRENKISNTQLYKMAGNAVTSNVISAIVKEMMK